MSVRAAPWSVNISEGAKADLKNIQRWTATNFGATQARVYEETLHLAISTLKSGPQTAGLRRRDDLGTGVFSLHVARKGRKGRHVLVLRLRQDREWELLRVLHDSMDPTRHLTSQR